MLATSTHQAFHAGLLLTALGFGFRHGIDWDHIGALTDITSSQDQPRRSMWFATLYALGHALVVFVLGFAAIMFAAQLPSGVDSVMERFVGATLIILAGYVFYSVTRHGREFRMRSRWMLLVTAVRTGMRWARRRARTELIEITHDHVHPVREAHDHEHAHDPNDEHIPAHVQVSGSSAISTAGGVHRHRHRHVAAMPDDPFENYAPRSVFGIGMIHGIGAETPTQVLIFLAVAGRRREGNRPTATRLLPHRPAGGEYSGRTRGNDRVRRRSRQSPGLRCRIVDHSLLQRGDRNRLPRWKLVLASSDARGLATRPAHPVRVVRW